FYGDLNQLAQPKIFFAWLRQLFRHDWVVYCKPPFGGPEHALRYLGAYTHRVAISNHRLISLADGQVTFRWRDSAHHNEQKVMSLSLDESLRRFLLHLLPKGFVRIRHFGFLANRRRATLLPLCRQALAAVQPRTSSQPLRLPPLLRTLPHSGTALFAAGPCTSSSGSPRLNFFCFARHPILDCVRRETTSASSTSPLAAACTDPLCLAWLRLRSRLSLQHQSGAGSRSLPTPSPTACDLRNPLQSSNNTPGHTQTYSKYIDSYMPGWLPSSRCIRSAPPNTAKPRPP